MLACESAVAPSEANYYDVAMEDQDDSCSAREFPDLRSVSQAGSVKVGTSNDVVCKDWLS